MSTPGAAPVKLPLTLALSLVPKMLGGGGQSPVRAEARRVDRFAVADALRLPNDIQAFVPDAQRGKFEAWARATFGPGASAVGLVAKPKDELDAEASRAGLVDGSRGTAAIPTWSRTRSSSPRRGATCRRRSARLDPRGRGRRQPGLYIEIRAEVEDRAGPHATQRDVRRARGHSAIRSAMPPALPLAARSELDARETSGMVFGPSIEATRVVAQTFFKAHQAELRSACRRTRPPARCGACSGCSRRRAIRRGATSSWRT